MSNQGRESLASLNATRRVFGLKELEEMPQNDEPIPAFITVLSWALVVIGAFCLFMLVLSGGLAK